MWTIAALPENIIYFSLNNQPSLGIALLSKTHFFLSTPCFQRLQYWHLGGCGSQWLKLVKVRGRDRALEFVCSHNGAGGMRATGWDYPYSIHVLEIRRLRGISEYLDFKCLVCKANWFLSLCMWINSNVTLQKNFWAASVWLWNGTVCVSLGCWTTTLAKHSDSTEKWLCLWKIWISSCNLYLEWFVPELKLRATPL